MHNAPSVSYPVGRCVFAARFFAILAILSAAVWTAWVWQQSWTRLAACAALSWAVALALAWRAHKQQTGQLTSDGESWHWQSAPEQVDARGRVTVLLDLQHTLLLRWEPLNVNLGMLSVNLWLSAQSAPEFWQDLRRAVYAQD